MDSNSTVDLTSLTENQQAVLKVLADADGEALWGIEVRQRLKEDYGIERRSRESPYTAGGHDTRELLVVQDENPEICPDAVRNRVLSIEGGCSTNVGKKRLYVELFGFCYRYYTRILSLRCFLHSVRTQRNDAL